MSKTQAVSKENEFTFEQIYAQHKNALYRYAMRFVKRADIAEEIVQSVFIKVWLHWHTVDPEKSLSSYLHTITRNLAFDHLKEVSVNTALLEEMKKNMIVQCNDTEEKVMSHDYDTLLQTIIANLPKQKQKILKLSRDQGLTHEEIAKALNISPKTVNNHITQALQIVRHYLSQHADIVPSIIFLLVSVLAC